MKVALSQKQAEQLAPYVDRVRSVAKLGTPGMLVAQISWDVEGRYWLTPAFLPHEVAKVVTEKGVDLPRLERRKPDASGADDAV